MCSLNPVYLYKNGENVVPSSPLDNILLSNDLKNYKISFYNIINGECLDTETKIDSFYNEITELAKSNKYLTTDHLIYSILIDDVEYIYVSLDNSIRSNMNSNSLAHYRLNNLLQVVKTILEQKPISVVFFSESCRPSFVGNINQRENEISWLRMRNTITDCTNLEFLVEKRNNEDYSGMSFGLSVWMTKQAKPFISNYYSKELIKLGFGSVAIGIKSNTNKIVWGVHFPLDFKNMNGENHGAITMGNLIKIMNDYPNSVCAIGDMNTIPRIITDEICKVVENNVNGYKLLLKDTLTFFGAYYDTIPISALNINSVDGNNNNPIYLLDVPNYFKYKILEYINHNA